MDLLDRLLAHDAWTTGQLLARCDALTDAQLDQTFDIGRGTVRETLWHIIRNVEVWTDLMAEREVRPDGGRSVCELRDRLERAGAELETFAGAVRDRGAWDETWVDRLDDPPRAKTFGGAIAHLITHSMHHRAQVLAMLRRLGLTDLPEGDVFSWEHRAGGSSYHPGHA